MTSLTTIATLQSSSVTPQTNISTQQTSLDTQTGLSTLQTSFATQQTGLSTPQTSLVAMHTSVATPQTSFTSRLAKSVGQQDTCQLSTVKHESPMFKSPLLPPRLRHHSNQEC